MRSRSSGFLIWVFAVALWRCIDLTAAEESTLQQLPFNHPGLVVDLGVGLWAWPVPCDADGDGDFDLIVSCPDKPSNGVWLFENPATSQEKFPVFKPARKLSKTLPYVTPSYVGSQVRVLTPGSEYPDFLRKGIDTRAELAVSPDFYQTVGKQPKGPRVRHNQWRYADYDGDGATDLIAGIEDWSDYGWDDAWNSAGEWTNGPLHGFVFWFRNKGTNETPAYAEPVRVEAAGKPVDVFGCPSPNFEDFDRDGDLDLLCGEFLDGFTYFENTGTRKEPKYDVGRRLKIADGTPLVMELEMIVPIAFDWDRDGDMDLIVGQEDGRVALLENTGELTQDRTPRFLPPRFFQQQADTLKCGALATPVGADWDGDGDIDIVSGNTAGYIEFFENLSGPREASPRWAAPRRLTAAGETFRIMAGKNGSIQGPAEAKWGYTTLNVADWDMDGLPDVVFNSIWGRVQWLKNCGAAKSPALSAPQSIEVEWPGTAPKPSWTWWSPQGKELVTQWRTTPLVHDFNGDGLPDLAMLDSEGYLAFFPRARRDGGFVLLPPVRAFCDASGEPLRLSFRGAGGSGRRKLCVVDWDHDGELDLLLNSSNADLYRGLGRQGEVWRFERVGTLASRNIEGHDVSPATVDFDGNGIPDFLGGAEDGRFYFMRHP